MIASEDYIDFLRREYLDDFIVGGGASVKFVVCGDIDRVAAYHRRLDEAARSGGYVYARVDADAVRIHMIDQVFFHVARQVDWDGLAATFLRQALAEISLPVPEGQSDLSLAAIAERHDFDPSEAKRNVDRHLQHSLYRDFTMAQEFRIAMLRLCQAQLRTGDMAQAEHDAVLDWLKGDLRQITKLRSALIFRRIARHNARHVLFSLARWLRRCGKNGLVLDLDLTRLAVPRRPPIDEAAGFYYTKAAVMDTYEVLRQLIDATDELTSCCVSVLAAPSFLTDDSRGLAAYNALKLRIWDEVRDRRRDNPFSSLVRTELSA